MDSGEENEETNATDNAFTLMRQSSLFQTHVLNTNSGLEESRHRAVSHFNSIMKEDQLLPVEELPSGEQSSSKEFEKTKSLHQFKGVSVSIKGTEFCMTDNDEMSSLDLHK